MPPPLLILLLTVATYASVWNGKADTKWYKDSKSEFTITTPEQLAGLAKLEYILSPKLHQFLQVAPTHNLQ